MDMTNLSGSIVALVTHAVGATERSPMRLATTRDGE